MVTMTLLTAIFVAHAHLRYDKDTRGVGAGGHAKDTRGVGAGGHADHIRTHLCFF